MTDIYYYLGHTWIKQLSSLIGTLCFFSFFCPPLNSHVTEQPQKLHYELNHSCGVHHKDATSPPCTLMPALKVFKLMLLLYFTNCFLFCIFFLLLRNSYERTKGDPSLWGRHHPTPRLVLLLLLILLLFHLLVLLFFVTSRGLGQHATNE